jgi:hypothetical protein
LFRLKEERLGSTQAVTGDFVEGGNDVPDSADKTPGIQFTRDEDFESLYANNVRFEISAWDLKLIFGVLDQRDPTAEKVEQHTAVSLAWPTVKIAAYHLLVSLVIHQANSGVVQLRPDVIPPRPDSSNPELQQSERRTAEFLAWIHDQFFGSDPYIPPSVAALQAALKTE